MDRKKTIIIAVMINAGLLAILLVAALLTQDEVIAPTPAMAVHKIDEKTVYEDVKELKVEEPLVHRLPPLVVEPEVVPAPPAPVVAVVAPAVVEEVIPEYKVEKGDNLDKIAKLNHTTVDEIIKLNRLSGSVLRIGQVLKIPKGTIVAAKPAPKKEPSADYYTVKVGDTPWTIAMKNHLKVDELLRLNAMNEEKARRLKPGDRLRIR
jgi:LysM repeat protein